MAKRRQLLSRDEPDPGYVERATRAERRRGGEDSATMARKLLSLPDSVIDGMALPQAVRDEMDEARRIRAPGALRRHERRLAQVLRGEDLEIVAAILGDYDDEKAHVARRFQRVESWRERLLADDAAMAELRALAPDIPREELTKLVDDARAERDFGRPKGASKELFRKVREWLDDDSPTPPDA